MIESQVRYSTIRDFTSWAKGLVQFWVIFSITLSGSVWPKPSPYHTSILWSHIYVIRCGVQDMIGWFWVDIFFKILGWIGLVQNLFFLCFGPNFKLLDKFLFFFKHIFIYFGLAFPNQHLLGKFGPTQSFIFVFFFLARKWCLLLNHDMIVWHRIIDYTVSISVAFKAKQNPVKQNKYYKYQLLKKKKKTKTKNHDRLIVN